MAVKKLTKKVRVWFGIGLVAGLLLAGALVFLLWLPQTHSASKTDGVHVTGFAGTIQMATAQIRVPQNIGQATFVTTGDIADMAKPSQENGAAVNAGDVTLPLGVIIPSGKTDGTYKGKVEVQQDGKIIASAPVTIIVQKASANAVPSDISQATPDRIATPDGSTIPYVKDELLVTLASNIIGPDQRIKEIADQTQGTIIGKLAEDNTYQLRYNVANIDELEKKRDDLKWIIGVEAASFNALADTETLPNDASFKDPRVPGDPWNDATKAQRTWGQRYIGLPSAWDKTTGNQSLKIGVIDGGFDMLHSDLLGNIAKDVGDGPSIYHKIALRFDHTPHGTYVAGTACAVGNNKVGIAGVMWHCKLGVYDAATYVPWPFTWPKNFGGYSYEAVVVKKAMIKAAEDGMRVANLSLGWGGVTSLCNQTIGGYTQMLIKGANDQISGAIKWAKDNKKDILWVMAAGNSCHDINEVAPAALAHDFPDNVMAIAAIGETEDMQADAPLQTYSNKGTDISVAAPGENIYTTSAKDPGAPDTASYKLASGTSLAAPFVTGLAGLVLSQHSEFTAKQVKQCIVDTANSTGHKVNGYSFRVIDAPKTLDCQPDPDPNSPLGTNQQCVFSFARLPEKCSSTNPTVKVKFTNVAGSDACVFESHLEWDVNNPKNVQIDTIKNLAVDASVPLGTQTFSQPGLHQISHTVVPKTGGPCLILEGFYEFTLLPKGKPVPAEDL